MSRVSLRRPSDDGWLPAPPQRFRPLRGGKLTISAVRGHWRFSGTTGGQGLPAVVWETSLGHRFWAALSDFRDDAILELVRRAEHLDFDQNGVA